MHDYEKLGAFYLGRPVEGGDEPVLYDSQDLTTHAVIIGMTGSGKTGLGITLIEEAAIDRIPVIALDPKGDLGNLLLTFPELAPADFAPWVDGRSAQAAGQTPADFAAAEAARWRQGLADWGQAPDRIARLKAAADFALYTPGSSAGLPLSVLGSLAAPAPGLREDADLYRQHLQGITAGLLTLVGVESDPVSGREHILVANVLDAAWQAGRSLDLATLIGAIQQPGLAKIGVLDLDTFFPPKDRLALAMRFNGLLASPGFAAWTEGAPLDAGALLFTPEGQPRVSVLSIAHLADSERMFLVTLLLTQLIAWMRTQPGTSSLRAILYMDEVAGYLPPVAMPASKAPLLTLLKQARAFGLGVVLATQNPVDLDYKALANAGTWFIGRLQTDQDRARVREGLLAAAGGTDPAGLDRSLAGLGKRCFLMHNVHESAPTVFQVRWTLAYLRGPLTREDIRRLQAQATAGSDATPAATAARPAAESGPAATPAGATSSRPGSARPVIPPGVPCLYAEPMRMPRAGERLVYQPHVLALAKVLYASAKFGVDQRRAVVLAAVPGDLAPDWAEATVLALEASQLAREPEPDAAFGECPAGALNAATLRAWQDQFRTWLRTERPVTLFRSPLLKVTSTPDEDEGRFRARLQLLAREERDRQVAALRQKYAGKLATLQERLRRAEQAVGREEQEATAAKLDTALSVGTALLGALMGRKALSATSAARIGTAVRRAGNLQKQSADVGRAGETVAAVQAAIKDLEDQLAAEITGLEAGYDAGREPLESVAVRPKATDITLEFFGLGWLPCIEDATGNLQPAWAGTGT